MMKRWTQKLKCLIKLYLSKLVTFIKNSVISERFIILKNFFKTKYNYFRDFIIIFYNKLNIFQKNNSNSNEKININEIKKIEKDQPMKKISNEEFSKKITNKELSKKDLEDIKRITSENSEFFNVSKKVDKYKKKEIFQMLRKNFPPKESLFILFIIALGVFFFCDSLVYERQLYFPGDFFISDFIRNKMILNVSIFFACIGLFIPVIFFFKKHANLAEFYIRLAVNYIYNNFLVSLLKILNQFSYSYLALIVSTKFIKYSTLTIYHAQSTWIPYGTNFVFLGVYVSLKYILILQLCAILFFYIGVKMFIQQNRYLGIGIFFIRLSTAFIVVIVIVFLYESYCVSKIIHPSVPELVSAIRGLYMVGLAEILFFNYYIIRNLTKECFDYKRKKGLEDLIQTTLLTLYGLFGCFLIYFLVLEYYASLL